MDNNFKCRTAGQEGKRKKKEKIAFIHTAGEWEPNQIFLGSNETCIQQPKSNLFTTPPSVFSCFSPADFNWQVFAISWIRCSKEGKHLKPVGQCASTTSVGKQCSKVLWFREKLKVPRQDKPRSSLPTTVLNSWSELSCCVCPLQPNIFTLVSFVQWILFQNVYNSFICNCANKLYLFSVALNVHYCNIYVRPLSENEMDLWDFLQVLRLRHSLIWSGGELAGT